MQHCRKVTTANTCLYCIVEMYFRNGQLFRNYHSKFTPSKKTNAEFVFVLIIYISINMKHISISLCCTSQTSMLCVNCILLKLGERNKELYWHTANLLLKLIYHNCFRTARALVVQNFITMEDEIRPLCLPM